MYGVYVMANVRYLKEMFEEAINVFIPPPTKMPDYVFTLSVRPSMHPSYFPFKFGGWRLCFHPSVCLWTKYLIKLQTDSDKTWWMSWLGEKNKPI